MQANIISITNTFVVEVNSKSLAAKTTVEGKFVVKVFGLCQLEHER